MGDRGFGDEGVDFGSGLQGPGKSSASHQRPGQFRSAADPCAAARAQRNNLPVIFGLQIAGVDAQRIGNVWPCDAQMAATGSSRDAKQKGIGGARRRGGKAFGYDGRHTAADDNLRTPRCGEVARPHVGHGFRNVAGARAAPGGVRHRLPAPSRWSCKLRPRSGTASLQATPALARTSCGPIPDRISSAGLSSAPADRTICSASIRTGALRPADL